MENKEKSTKGMALTGAFAALAASSCCIPPAIAAIAGIGGISSSLSWVEQYRPYLIAFAVLAIGYSWYAYLRRKPNTDTCGCSTEKPKFYQTKGYLIGISLFALASITFPYYNGIFYGHQASTWVAEDPANVYQVELKIKGMTCEGCEHHITQSVNLVPGVTDVSASYSKGNAIVKFDKSATDIDAIKKAVDETGYEVTAVYPLTPDNDQK